MLLCVNGRCFCIIGCVFGVFLMMMLDVLCMLVSVCSVNVIDMCLLVVGVLMCICGVCVVGIGCLGGVGCVSRLCVVSCKLLMIVLFDGVYVVMFGLLMSCMSVVFGGMCGLKFLM